jgi:hypothetical protein
LFVCGHVLMIAVKLENDTKFNVGRVTDMFTPAQGFVA